MGIFFYVLIRSRNSIKFFDKCIESVLHQNYRNFKILFIDDSSGYSPSQIRYIRKKLHGHVCIFNKTRKYSLYNAYYLINKYAIYEDGVVFNLDGDDWLANKYALSYVANIYEHNPKCLLTYGGCVVWNGKYLENISKKTGNLVNLPYSRNTVKHSSYRKEVFLPLHPRTWKVNLFKKIKVESFKDSEGIWLKYAEDQAIFFPMLEMANGNYKCIRKSLYVYNVETQNSDIKENLLDLIKDEINIRRKKPYETL